VRLIICNSYSNAENEKKQICDLVDMGLGLGLAEKDLTFTSELTSQWCQSNNHDIQLGVPRKVILDLMRVSDVFILPSVSEACSVIMLEAGISKNLMVLNEDLYSLHEFGGQGVTQNSSDRAVYFSFGSITRPIVQYTPSEEAWFTDHAKVLINFLAQDKALQFFRQTRKRYTPDFVYASQLEPLLRRPN